jgi:phospholipid/cholesterol/gamma-HCH transport system ATP-binding protein
MSEGNQSDLAIEAVGLDCGYDDVALLREVTFTVQRGEIFFIIGGSGSGKSTLLRHLLGLRIPMAGSLRYFGQDFLSQDPGERRALLRTFGVLYQGGALWSSLSLSENIALPLELHTDLSRRDRLALASLKLAQVGLSGFEEFYPAEISGGMRKRAGLARALALDPRIVFCDEPSAGLDPVTGRKLDELVVRLRDTLGTTMVIVSHEVQSILGIGDRLIMIDREARGIVAEGRPRELAARSEDARVREFFGVPATR